MDFSSFAKWLKVLLLLSVLVLLVGILIYANDTKLILTVDNPITIIEAKYNNNSQTITVSPTSKTLPKTKYSVLIDNTLFTQDFSVSWNQLELNINKLKTISHHLSTDEAKAIELHPSYSTMIYKAEHTYPKAWVILPSLALILICFLIYSKCHKPQQIKETWNTNQASPPIDETSNPASKPGELFSRLLNQALTIMDETAKWYSNEDKANRELVSCLNSILYQYDTKGKAIYHYYLGDGRTIDAKIYHILMEGKLSPSQSEIDRLLGQLSDYTKYSNEIHIVIYGSLSDMAKSRILNEISDRYPDIVFLDYLNNPKRQRKNLNEEASP